MKYELVKLPQFSGNKASVYTFKITEKNVTLFENFVKENVDSFKSEIIDIFNTIKTIGNKTGARVNFFKEFEGRLGDGVCALYDSKSKNLRLYCIRFGMDLIILGGGGFKPKNIRALQENSKLTDENNLLRWLSTEITKRQKDKDLRFINDYFDFEGDLIFTDENINTNEE